MKVGVLGLGFIGLPIALKLHRSGHEVFSWTKTQRETLWVNSTHPMPSRELSLDSLIIASGAARPGAGNESSEIETTIRIAEKLKLSSATHIYYMSSGAVYGECSSPKSECDSPRPSTMYGRAKLTTELALAEQFDQRFSALRIGNVVDWENPYGLFREFCKISGAGRSINFYGDTSSARDYIEINSFVEILVKLIELRSHHPVVNIASGNSVSLGLLANETKRVSNEALEINWHSAREQDVQSTQLDIRFLKQILEVTSKDFLYEFENFLRRNITV
jgi:nucleoside-diphosphate-sugar epimerase